MPGEQTCALWDVCERRNCRDRVDQFAGRHRDLDSVRKTDEFLVAMARHALPDDRASSTLMGGEERRRAVPDIIVGHCPVPSLLLWLAVSAPRRRPRGGASAADAT